MNKHLSPCLLVLILPVLAYGTSTNTIMEFYYKFGDRPADLGADVTILDSGTDNSLPWISCKVLRPHAGAIESNQTLRFHPGVYLGATNAIEKGKAYFVCLMAPIENDPISLPQLAFCLAPLDLTPIPFQSDLWIEAGKYPRNRIRQTMYKDLISAHQLIGMKNEDIVKLLGHPSQETQTTLIYMMGPEPDAFIAIDDVWLQFEIENGVIISFRWING